MENTIDGYHPNFAHQSYFAELHRGGRPRIDAFDGDSIMQCRVLGNGHTLMDYRPYYGALQGNATRRADGNRLGP